MSVLANKDVIAQAIPESVDFNYREGAKVPEFVIKGVIERYTNNTNKQYQMLRTIYCESHYNNVQSYVVSRGIREPSYGIAQIHIGYNKVTKEQALDVEFAIKWMAENFETTKWYAYNRLQDTCN